MNTELTALQNKYDIIVLVEASMTNPNGDPDAANQPRIDPVTGTGIISNVCLKRKIRDYLAEVRGVELYHANGVVLRDQRSAALVEAGITPSGGEEEDTSDDSFAPKPKVKGKKATGRAAVSGEDLRRNQQVVCRKFYDARAFGALMDTGAARAANARGPVHIEPATSFDPIRLLDFSITRQSVETPEEREKERMMGTQSMVRYGLYSFCVTVSPFHALRTGFSNEDLGLLREALTNMFELDQSSNRKLTLRGIHAFRHVSRNGQPCLGHASRISLIERISATKREDVTEPLAFGDYLVTVDLEDLPADVTYERWA